MRNLKHSQKGDVGICVNETTIKQCNQPKGVLQYMKLKSIYVMNTFHRNNKKQQHKQH